MLFSGLTWVLRTLQRVAEDQWTDDAPLKEALLVLQNQLDSGEITEAEYRRQEAEIVAALREVRARRARLHGESGADPYSFPPSG